jgi:hypothetical protein
MDIEEGLNGLLMETGRHLNLTGRGRTFGGCFVGSKPREYLVIEVPRSTEIDACLTEGHAVSGLFCAAGKMVQFDSSIIAFTKRPAWLLFLAYPSSLEDIHDLRSTCRAECSIPCILVTLFNLKQYMGIIANINTDGCNCSLSPMSSAQTKMLNPENKVLLEFDLPGKHGRIKIFGEVMNIKRDRSGVSLGIKFDDDPQEEALRGLSEYLLNMVKLPSTQGLTSTQTAHS